MACGAPVVCSSHESMDEACGDAAVRADPESPPAIAAAVEVALDRRDELVARGLAHAARFTWSHTAGSSSTPIARRPDARRRGRLAARPDPRRHGALHGGARGDELARLGQGGSGRIAALDRDAWWIRDAPAVGQACAARRPPLPDVPRADPAAADAAGRYRSRPRRPAPPRGLQPMDAALQPRVRTSGGAGGEPSRRRLGVHEAGARRAAGHAPGER